MSRRRIVAALWVIAVALAVGLVVGAGRLWGKKSGPSAAVAAYIKSVDGVQQQMRLPLTHLLTAYRSFSTQIGDPRKQAPLTAAERTLRTLELRLAALPAPPAATELRRLLAQLVRADDGVAVEIEDLARFMPRFHQVIGVTALASRQLGRTLATATPPTPHTVRGTAKQIAAARAAFAAAATRAAATQADAVDAYDRVVALALRGLRTLRPPPVMAPAYRTQVQTLAATDLAGAALAQGLRKQNRAGVPQLSRRFTEASRLSGSIAAQRAEIAAIKAYDARVRTIGNVQARIQREVSRLQRLLG